MNSRFCTRRQFLKEVTLATTALSMAGSAYAGTNTTRKPNILLILTDDQGWGDVTSHGNDIIDTPVMDSLAASGARFDRFFVSPVCAPTRASLLTGRYHPRTGVHGVTRAYETMRSNEVTLAQVFKNAGYATGCFGKWHNGAHYPYHPNGKGFDEFLGFCAGHWNNYFDTNMERNGQQIKVKGYITDVLTDAALKFMENNKDEPFFCYIPYNCPHGPFQVPDKYFDKYKAMGLDDRLACIYGMCENIDDNMRRLLEKLDELNLRNDTIVIFITDNGPNSDRYNGDMRGRKGSVHEGGMRVPCFISWPGHIESGTVIEQISAHIDILPTLVELAGVPMIDTLPLDGTSLVPLLQNEAENWPDRTLFQIWSNRGTARTQQYRLVDERNRIELFDMIADPGEKNDIAAEKPEITEKLKAEYDEWYKDATRDGFDPIPIPIGYEQMKEVAMPGHEAFLEPPNREGISYLGRAGWANDWITNWTDTEAYPSWEVEVVRNGAYEISLMYVCKEENVGARVRVEVGGQSVEGVVEKAHDPEPIPSPDRIPRGEVYEKVWASLKLGTVNLSKGRTQLRVRALTKPGETVMDLKAVVVTYE